MVKKGQPIVTKCLMIINISITSIQAAAHLDPSPPPKSSSAGVIIIPIAEMRKSRLGGQNSPREEESVCYRCGSGAGGELEKEKQPPYHFKRGRSKRLSSGLHCSEQKTAGEDVMECTNLGARRPRGAEQSLRA